jgi:hypothetical protein
MAPVNLGTREGMRRGGFRGLKGCQEAARPHWQFLAGTVAGERQLTGIIKSDDRFQAASSAKGPVKPRPIADLQLCSG